MMLLLRMNIICLLVVMYGLVYILEMCIKGFQSAFYMFILKCRCAFFPLVYLHISILITCGLYYPIFSLFLQLCMFRSLKNLKVKYEESLIDFQVFESSSLRMRPISLVRNI